RMSRAPAGVSCSCSPRWSPWVRISPGRVVQAAHEDPVLRRHGGENGPRCPGVGSVERLHCAFRSAAPTPADRASPSPATSSGAPMSQRPTPVPFEVHEEGGYLHGTKAVLAPGDLLVAGHGSNYEDGRTSRHIYFSETLDAAAWGAELATGDGPG